MTIDHHKLHYCYLHVTLMSPSTQLFWLSQYIHLLHPNLSLAPAWGDEGEFVPLPLCMWHIECELPKVLIKVLFCALFWGKELFWVLFWVLLIVPELFWALFKALYFALLWNTFLGNLLKHYFENFLGGKELFWAPFLVLFKVLELFSALFKALHFTLFSWTFLGHFLKH